MRRTTTLTVTSLLGLALLTPTTATAAGETCRGEAATIVGTTAQRLVGTEGRDVIVTNGASRLDALGGDDLICITGATTGGPDLFNAIDLDAGPGNDMVDATVVAGWAVSGELGSGADRFEGGGGSDSIRAGSLDAARGYAHVDTEADVLLGGGGDDNLRSGQAAAANADVVDGGAGDDFLAIWGDRTGGGTVSAGTGTDTLMVLLRPGANDLDAPDGRLTSSSAPALEWNGVERYHTSPTSLGGEADLDFVGTPGDDMLEVYSTGRLRAALGDGDDDLYVLRAPGAGSDIRAGDGTDSLTTGTTRRRLGLDLRKGALRVGSEAAYPATGFEDAHLMARVVTLAGTGGANDLKVLACRGTVDGRGGNDSLSRVFDGWFETYDFACTERLLLRGGKGRDDLRGSGGPDRILGGPANDSLQGVGGADTLIGGPGRDRSNGGDGRDRCSAEQKKRCES